MHVSNTGLIIANWNRPKINERTRPFENSSTASDDEYDMNPLVPATKQHFRSQISVYKHRR